MTEYNPWYKPGEQLMQCLRCGAAVCDTELHSQWHEGRDRMLAHIVTNLVLVDQSLRILGRATGLEE